VVSKEKVYQDTENEYFIVNSTKDLEAYLLDPDSGYINPTAGRTFNLIDMVLINGDTHVTPWDEKNKQIFCLVKMCLNSKKPLFCTGGAMHTLVYLCSSDLDYVSFIIINPPRKLR
jgi:hypothetical protein